MRRFAWVLVLAVLLAAWEAYVQLRGVPEYLLPAPSQIAQALWDDRSTLASQALVTLKEMLLGFAAAVVIGFAAAVLLHLVPWLRGAMQPILIASQSVPVVAIAPILVIDLGFGLAPKGSSSSSTGLPASSVRRNATRWRMPPDSLRGGVSVKPTRPKRSNSGSACVRASPRAAPASSRARPALSSAERQGSSRSRWGISAQRSRPAPSIVPASGCTSPASSVSSVDLPQPLGPMMPSASPARRLTVTLERQNASRPGCA
jgi:hypothetical protein